MIEDKSEKSRWFKSLIILTAILIILPVITKAKPSVSDQLSNTITSTTLLSDQDRKILREEIMGVRPCERLMRKKAVIDLISCGSTNDVLFLMAFILQPYDPDIIEHTIDSLSNTGNASIVVPALLQAAKDPLLQIRSNAAAILHRRNDYGPYINNKKLDIDLESGKNTKKGSLVEKKEYRVLELSNLRTLFEKVSKERAVKAAQEKAASFGSFAQLAYYKSFKGIVDFYDPSNSTVARKTLNIFKEKGRTNWSFREAQILKWEEKKGKYVSVKKLKYNENEKKEYQPEGILFGWEVHRYFQPGYTYNIQIKNIRLNYIGNSYNQETEKWEAYRKLIVYVDVETENTYYEKAVIKIYSDSGRFSKLLYRDTFIKDGTSLGIANVVATDVNADGKMEILIGIWDMGEETSKIFVYGQAQKLWQ